MPKIRIDTDIADEYELAACTAVIASIFAEEKEQARYLHQQRRSGDARLSGWRRAALLEATGRAPRGVSASGWVKKTLWAVAAFLLLCQPIQAQGAAPPVVRVALAFGKTETRIFLPDGGVLTDVRTGDLLAQLPPQSSWSVAYHAIAPAPQLSFAGSFENPANSTVYIARRSEYRNVAFVSSAVPAQTTMVPIPPGAPARFWLPATRMQSGRAYLLCPSGSSATFILSGKHYRGALLINPKPSAQGGFDLINQVELEQYLQSVVPCEMPSSWPIEALKAQAIAARSYAVASIGKHQADGYDVKATIEDQVYSGVASETAATNEAVASTAGLVLRCHGQVITAYFHSAAGGWTELPENVWGRSLPYLKAVADYDDQSPYFCWNRAISTAAIEQSLRASGKTVGTILTMMPLARGSSPRVRWLLVSGSERTLLLSGEEARRVFSLPSTCFNVAGNGDAYVFAGRGFGHGVGMSQWGAKALAEAGYTAADILNYYYKDVSLEHL